MRGEGRSLRDMMKLMLQGRLLAALFVAAVLAPAPARAQNLDEGKTAPQLFANGCSTCHRGPQGAIFGGQSPGVAVRPRVQLRRVGKTVDFDPGSRGKGRHRGGYGHGGGQRGDDEMDAASAYCSAAEPSARPIDPRLSSTRDWVARQSATTVWNAADAVPVHDPERPTSCPSSALDSDERRSIAIEPSGL